jgi:hypothetical protein
MWRIPGTTGVVFSVANEISSDAFEYGDVGALGLTRSILGGTDCSARSLPRKPQICRGATSGVTSLEGRHANVLPADQSRLVVIYSQPGARRVSCKAC